MTNEEFERLERHFYAVYPDFAKAQGWPPLHSEDATDTERRAFARTQVGKLTNAGAFALLRLLPES